MASNYTSDPTAAESPSAAPGFGVDPILSLPVDGDARNAASVEQAFKILGNNTAWAAQQLAAAVAAMFFTGRNGAFTFDGATTPSWATRSGSVYTLTDDVFPTDWTFNAGTSLKTSGFRVFGQGTCDTSATSGGGIITCDGDAGASPVGGAAGATGTVLSGAGGSGGGDISGASGGAGANAANSFCGNGGAGGGISTTFAGGTATPPSAALGRPDSSIGTLAGFIVGISGGAAAITALAGGAQGGGGKGTTGGTGTAGGGGSGGGVLPFFFRILKLANANDIRCAGGAGGNGVLGTSTGVGGGGGGGGGLLIAGYASCNKTLSSAVNCPGGAAGIGDGTGTTVPATAGATGLLIRMSYT